MEERLIRQVTGFICTVAMLTVAALFYLPEVHLWAEEAAALKELKKAGLENQMTGLEMLDYNTTFLDQEIIGDAFTQQLRLKLPEDISGEDVMIENQYLTQTISIRIPTADEDYLYEYPMVGKSNHIDNLTYESHAGAGILEITLDEVFEVESTFDDQYMYLDFLTPQEVYDKVVVIDAGHGSRAPGAVKQGIYEKNIDLAIVLELKAIFDADQDSNIGVYYTRTDDSNPTFDQRVQLANKSHADVFISIHNNSTKSGRFSSISGTSVMYDEKKGDGAGSSKHLAEICLEELTSALSSNNKGIVEGNDIYIIRTAEVPVALIEVGFMTNQQELSNLNSPEYQRKAAQGIYQAILRAFEEGY